AFALGEKLQHAANVRPGTAAGELAVAECAGSTFAKQVVALGIERTTGIEGTHVVDAVAHRAATLPHYRARAALRQEIRPHKTAGPRADDDGPVSQRFTAGLGHDKRRLGIYFDSRFLP